MEKLAHRAEGLPQGVTTEDVAGQLARQLQIVNVILQDLDFDIVLGETIQVICALHQSRMGFLFLYQPHVNPAFAEPGGVTFVTAEMLYRQMDGIQTHCSHAVVHWCGCVYNLLQQSTRPLVAAMLGQIGDTRGFVTTPLVAYDRVLGRVFMLLPPGQEFADVDSRNFSNLVAQTALALERARRLDQAKQRQRETEALYQTVHEISCSLNLDEVLKTIVRRARELLDADTTFLSVRHPGTDDVYMRVSEGLNTRIFYEGSYKLREGLSGLAAARREPLVSLNYLTDPRFKHIPHVDHAVSVEGIVTMLCVPLIVQDEVIGALFVGNRRPTHFTEDNIKLARSLGNSASVAIEKAWLYEKEREAVTKLTELNEFISSQHEMLSKSMYVHDQLARLLLSGHGTEDITRTLADLVSNPVIVEDHLFRLVCRAFPDSSSGEADDQWLIQPLPREALQDPGIAETIRLLTESRHPSRITQSTDRGLREPRIMAPIIVGQHLLGYVSIIESHKPLQDFDHMVLERAASILALEMASQKAALDVEARLSGDFLDIVLSGKYESEDEVLRRANHFGYDLRKPRWLMALAVDAVDKDLGKDGRIGAGPLSPEKLLLDLVKYAAGRRGMDVIVTARGSVVVVLVSASDSDTAESPACIANWLLTEINNNPWRVTASAGLGHICHKIADYAVSYREATQCLAVLKRLGKTRQVLSFDQLGLLRLLFRVEDKAELSAFTQQTLGPLLEYDRRHGTNLVQTVHAYLDNNGNLQATAKNLHVHVNTLIYRLQRIAEICQIDPDDAETRLDLHIALKILQAM